MSPTGTVTGTREPLPIRLAESGVVPDALLRKGIRRLLDRRLEAARRSWEKGGLEDVLRRLESEPMAPAPEAANRQHYARPPAFFRRVLGPRIKYSSGYWPAGTDTLAAAEDAMLELTCRRAQIRDGLRILDLGCGWGALTLWIAERYPEARVTSVSNSPEQVRAVRRMAAERGFEGRVRVVGTDVSAFRPEAGSFDRVVSVEMFEHLRDHGRLLARIARWLAPDGRLFVHVFSHRRHPYFFSGESAGAWMGRHFFTGGLMPSHELLPSFDRHMALERAWWLGGRHYARTAEAWLRNLDEARAEAEAILTAAGEPDPALQVRRWRLFFLSVAELFGYAGGEEWGVSHYRFRPRAAHAAATGRPGLREPEPPDGVEP